MTAFGQALTGIQKGAVVLRALDRNQAAQVLRLLPPDIIKRLVPYLAQTEAPDFAMQAAVLYEVTQSLDEGFSQFESGIDYTQEILDQALGPNRSAVLMRQMSDAPALPFAILLQANPEQVAAVLAHEHPQLIAVMLAGLPASTAALLLAKLPEVLTADVTRALAHLRQVDPAVLKDLESVLETKISASQTMDVTGGIDRIIPILNAAEPSKEQAILDQLATMDPELANQVRDQLFTFEDLRTLDDRLLQTILPRIDLYQLAMALRKSSAELKDRIFANMTQEQGRLLREEIDTLGIQTVHTVEKAQHAITTLIQELEQAHEIELPHGEPDTMV